MRTPLDQKMYDRGYSDGRSEALAEIQQLIEAATQASAIMDGEQKNVTRNQARACAARMRKALKPFTSHPGR